MATVRCPHCGETNLDAGQFCASCGKALPTADAGGPQVVAGNMVAQTAAGRTVQADQLRKQAGKAFGALLAVAILTLIGGFILYALLMNVGTKEAKDLGPVLLAVNVVVALVFAGLAFWARSNPLPAAIVGLVLFISIHLVSAIIDPTSIFQGIIVKIIVIVVLASAIQAGTKYKQLKEQTAPGY